MKKIVFSFAILASFFQFCSTSKKADASTSTNTAPVVTTSLTFDKDVLPMIQTNCAPCHITGKGRLKSLDQYDAVKSSSADILRRIKKNPGEPGFMPMKHPKLSETVIASFEQWYAGGMPK